MKTSFFKIFLYCTLVILPTLANSQSFSSTCSYDLNGNRITATVIYLTTTNKSAKLNADTISPFKEKQVTDSLKAPAKGWESPLTETLTGLKMNIYPNPTHGMLIIGLTGISADKLENSANSILVFDMQGRNVFSLKNIGFYSNIDLSGLPNGNYVLKTFICGQAKEYKIIKN